MADASLYSIKLVLKNSGSPMSFTNVDKDATDDALYEFADALSSLRLEKPDKIVKVATYILE